MTQAVLPLLLFLTTYFVLNYLFFAQIVQLCQLAFAREDYDEDVRICPCLESGKVPEYLVRLSATYYKELDGDDEASAAEGETLCGICYISPSNAVFMECKHGGLCYTCALEVWRTQESCHLCRKKICQVLELRDEANHLCKVVSVTNVMSEIA